MKRWFMMMTVILFLAGCGAAARESGFYEHDSLYKSWTHLKFSNWGYKNVDQKDVERTKTQNWWGKTVEGTK
jgi:hypothetical protein